MVVAPFHSKLKRSALGILSNWPIVLQWHHASYKKIMEPRPNIQVCRITCQNVLFTHRPSPTFYIYFIPVSPPLYTSFNTHFTQQIYHNITQISQNVFQSYLWLHWSPKLDFLNPSWDSWFQSCDQKTHVIKIQVFLFYVN